MILYRLCYVYFYFLVYVSFILEVRMLIVILFVSSYLEFLNVFEF